jgi:hypothetical protein
LAEPWWELLLRGSLVNLVLFVLFRQSGKRQAGADDAARPVAAADHFQRVQNAMIGEDTSVIGGLLVPWC